MYVVWLDFARLTLPTLDLYRHATDCKLDCIVRWRATCASALLLSFGSNLATSEAKPPASCTKNSVSESRGVEARYQWQRFYASGKCCQGVLYFYIFSVNPKHHCRKQNQQALASVSNHKNRYEASTQRKTMRMIQPQPIPSL